MKFGNKDSRVNDAEIVKGEALMQIISNVASN